MSTDQFDMFGGMDSLVEYEEGAQSGQKPSKRSSKRKPKTASAEAVAVAVDLPPDCGFPVPLPEGYFFDGTGIALDDSTKRITDAPVWVSAIVRSHDGSNFGRVVKFIDCDGQLKTTVVSCKSLGDGNSVPSELFGNGAMLIPSKYDKFRDYLAACNPTARAYSTSRLGWVDTPDERLIYALPDGAISSTGDTTMYHMPSSPNNHAHALHVSGTFEDWKRNIAEPARGNPLLVFSLCYAIAAPLLKLTRNTASGGVHFYGQSSTGKTTLLQVAASVWGHGVDPAMASSLALIQNWNATANAFEVRAETANDGVLLLDEIGQCAGKVVDDLCYRLMNGQGKGRLDSSAAMKEARAWRVLVMSSGERSIAEIVKDEGKEQKAGQRIRFLDIPTSERIIVETHGVEASPFANALKRACGEHYGHAGREFIRQLLQSEEGASFSTARELVELVHSQIAPDLILPDCSAEQQRAIERLALAAVAGALAFKFRVLPFLPSEVINAVKHVRDLWLSDGGQTDQQRAVDNIREFILKHESRFQLEGGEVPHNRAGFYLASHKAGGLWLFTSDGFREACVGFNPTMAAKALQKLGLLFTNQNRLKAKINASEVRGEFYAVNGALLKGAVFQRELREPCEPA